MRFRRADTTDISELMQWFDSPENCKLWGGPEFEYPFTAETFFRDLKWSSIDSYSLVDASGEVVGFGQVYDKLNRHHLARIVINPKHRGKGHGAELLASLIGEGRNADPQKEYSLYVYKRNSVAIRCYRGVGFEEHALPTDDAGFDNCVFMVLKPVSAA